MLFVLRNGHDGMARAELCGGENGDINIYIINSVNLPDAESIEFRSVSHPVNYQDKKCEYTSNVNID